MKTWQDRLLELLDKSEYRNVTELCRAAGVSTSTFSTALKGSHVPKQRTVEKVAKVLDSTWQWILNGDEAEVVTTKEVPVLNSQDVRHWLRGDMDIVTSKHRILAPEPVSTRCFAWIVDTIDMSPFEFGSTVILNPDFDFVRRHFQERIYVLAMKKRPVAHSLSFSDIEMAVARAESIVAGQPIPDQPEYEKKHDHVVLVELARTIVGFELISTNPRSNLTLNFADYEIAGRVKYSITRY